MTAEEIKTSVKINLRYKDDSHDLIISDTVMAVADYCNLSADCIPPALEPFIRRKVRGIVDYEDANGTGFTPEIQSIKEGDGSITWAQTDGNTRASIYGLSGSDRRELRRHRRLRGYAEPICGNV